MHLIISIQKKLSPKEDVIEQEKKRVESEEKKEEQREVLTQAVKEKKILEK